MNDLTISGPSTEKELLEWLDPATWKGHIPRVAYEKITKLKTL